MKEIPITIRTGKVCVVREGNTELLRIYPGTLDGNVRPIISGADALTVTYEPMEPVKDLTEPKSER